MQYSFSKRTMVQTSATAEISALAQQKKKNGETVYDLGIGEPVIAVDQRIISAVTDAMKQGRTGYPPAAGYASLRESVSSWHNRIAGSSFSAAESLITPGGKMALYMLLQALLGPGDEIVVCSPYWVSYPTMAALAGGQVREVRTSGEDGWKVVPEQLEAAISERTRAVVFNNGANPTGALYNSKELYALIRKVHDRGIVFISDEVYSGLVYDGSTFSSAASFPEFSETVVIVQSFSKHFAMTGLRVGMVFADQQIIRHLTALQSQTTSGAASISQAAAEAALKDADEISEHVRSTIEKRRNHLYLELNRLFKAELTRPAAGLYAFVPASTFAAKYGSDTGLAMRMIDQARTAVVPGSAFGAPGYIRISFGIPEPEISAGLEAIHQALS
ncbi:MAG: Aspartate aminotransferase [candidate division WS6 bacterium OLB20]|uniref:Aminotransferase n=1 Tax=candidate division WS6 bacterium OLB20 TaxID=1617426 RepID=A0A136LXT8_9BACT|nr:MAG: Aspartate aminotransferase [candidate division WS6 bacterium OLB20]